LQGEESFLEALEAQPVILAEIARKVMDAVRA
jgi:hypothetical protein